MLGRRAEVHKLKTPSAPGAMRAPAALAILLVWGLAGCSSYSTFRIESLPPAEKVVIDGRADDWAGRLFVVEDRRVSLGFLNDRDCLYLCLRTDDPGMQRQILRTGLTVWIDPAGGRKKALGIKHPVGMTSEEQRMWRQDQPKEETDAPGALAGNLTDVVILHGGSAAPESLDIAEARGWELKSTATGKSFAVEIKVPLAGSGEAAVKVGAPPGGTVGIGFETGKVDLNSLTPGPSGGRLGAAGGLPPVGGVMTPGRMKPNNTAIPEELKIWATVKLGTGNEPAPAEVRSTSR